MLDNNVTVFSAPNLKEISKNKTFAILECTIADSCVPDSCTVDCTANDGNSLIGISNEFTNGRIRVNVTGLTPFTNYFCKGYASIESENSEKKKPVQIAFPPPLTPYRVNETQTWGS